jgi:hypothetical protein
MQSVSDKREKSFMIFAFDKIAKWSTCSAAVAGIIKTPG